MKEKDDATTVEKNNKLENSPDDDIKATDEFSKAMKKFKQEFSGPYFNKEENVKLKNEQRKNRS